MSKQNLKLLDQVHNTMRLGHYSIHTERSYYDWIRRYVFFHHTISPWWFERWWGQNRGFPYSFGCGVRRVPFNPDFKQSVITKKITPSTTLHTHQEVIFTFISFNPQSFSSLSTTPFLTTPSNVNPTQRRMISSPLPRSSQVKYIVK